MSEKTAVATFAGGCFWCMQPPFDHLEGVLKTQVGYTGGATQNPTYEEVCGGRTGHAEAVTMIYDPARITYQELLDTFWRNIDPTTENQQFADYGTQYRTAIFYHDAEQKNLAEKSKSALEESRKFASPIVTEIVPAVTFYPAEEYHQAYYKSQATHYKLYRVGSGREGFLNQTWPKNKKINSK